MLCKYMQHNEIYICFPALALKSGIFGLLAFFSLFFSSFFLLFTFSTFFLECLFQNLNHCVKGFNFPTEILNY